MGENSAPTIPRYHSHKGEQGKTIQNVLFSDSLSSSWYIDS